MGARLIQYLEYIWAAAGEVVVRESVLRLRHEPGCFGAQEGLHPVHAQRNIPPTELVKCARNIVAAIYKNRKKLAQRCGCLVCWCASHEGAERTVVCVEQ